jgi:hypothetical protein
MAAAGMEVLLGPSGLAEDTPQVQTVLQFKQRLQQ